jgi:hypothetical protein
MEQGLAVECSVDILASCEEVFDVVHDYEIRLYWDTLLSQACILDKGVKEAGLGVSTLCVGRAALGKIAVETVYVSFDRGRVAAVKMKRGPWFLADFAASIRHTAIPSQTGESSRVTYKLRIKARPQFLRFLLNPLLRIAFQVETNKRLASLKRYVETRRQKENS